MDSIKQSVPKNKRLLSLDVLRGITIAGMILVNNGGPVNFAPLEHSKWNGLSLADIVFPFFLFMVGISTYLSLRKYDFHWSVALVRKITKRTLLILLIGWGIYWFNACCQGDFLPFSHLRIPGVLQRIALCYGIVSVLAVSINHKWFPHIAVGLLVVYTLILIVGNGYACNGSNVLAIVDHAVFGPAHLYHKSPIDPEGLLGTIPSIAHTLLGFIAGEILMERTSLKEKMLRLLLYGFLLSGLGFLFQYGLPLNKRIWSPTFVLFTCGLASSLLACLIGIIDIKDKKCWTPFFESFGINPLFLYIFSELLASFFFNFHIKNALYGVILSVVSYKYIASLIYAILFVLLNWIVGYPLYKKRIYIKL